jgi:GH24 family phage-related lysozyme (muramidase)
MEQRRLMWIATCTTNETLGSLQTTSVKRSHIDCLHLSARGAAFIQDWEKLRLNYYNDDLGYCTVGWGHLVHGKLSCQAIGIQPGTAISRTQAESFFGVDAVKHEKIVRTVIRVPLYQCDFDALCSLAFNVGDIARVAPTLCRKINSGAYADAVKEFLDITNGGISGLVKRRQQEHDMYLEGNYDSTH